MVGVGELRVSTEPGEVLATCVGSCVAVALTDPSVRVAGLLHAVLPERHRPPVGEQAAAYYVDSGLALLLSELHRRGAKRENLRAAVAGGASLLRDESPYAIGERNLRATLDFLSRQEISVRVEGVGGEIGRRVELDVGTGDVKVTGTASLPCSVEDQEVAPPGFGEIRDWISGLGPNPAVAGALLEAIHATQIDWGSVADVASRDAVLTLQLLRLANSQAYGRPKRVGSFPEALEVLGASQLRRICVLVGTARNASHSLADLPGLEPHLRAHAQASALVARRLTEGTSPGFRRAAFTACLLHRVGAVASSASALLGRSPGDEPCRMDALGARLLGEWSFPQPLVDAVRLHRFPHAAERSETELAGVVDTACALADLLGIPCDWPTGPLRSTAPSPSVLATLVQDLRAAGLLSEEAVRGVSQGGFP